MQMSGPFAQPWLESDAFAPMPGLPLIVEESTEWYNNNGPVGVTDGLWGNFDQWTTRHGRRASDAPGAGGSRSGGGTTAYLDGRVELFVPPAAYSNENTSAGNGAGGFNAHDIYVIQPRVPLLRRLEGLTNRYGGVNRYVP